MNRRKAIKAGFAGAATVLVAPLAIAETNKRFIDRRLCSKIKIEDLEDGESGYVADTAIVASNDGMLYFLLRSNNIVYREVNESWGVTTLISRQANHYLVKPSQKTIDNLTPVMVNGKNERGYYAVKPAALAHHKGYPLNTKSSVELEGKQYPNCYLVPRDWETCLEHQLVKNNIKEFELGYALLRMLMENGLPYGNLCIVDPYKGISPEMDARLDKNNNDPIYGKAGEWILYNRG